MTFDIINKHGSMFVGYLLNIVIMIVVINCNYILVMLYIAILIYQIVLLLVLNNVYSSNKQSILNEENIKKYATKIKCPINIEVEI